MTGIYIYDFTCLNASYEAENNTYPATVVAQINTPTTFSHPLRQIFLLRSLININNRHSSCQLGNCYRNRKLGLNFWLCLVKLVMEVIVVAMLTASFI